MEQNRRRHLRKVPEKFAFIQIERDEVGKVLNVSEGGLSFCSFAPISQHGPLYFWMSFNLRDRIEAMAEVAWTDSSGKIGGLRFLHQSQISREQLRLWLSQLPSEQTLAEEALQRAMPRAEQGPPRIAEPDRVARFVAKARSSSAIIPLEPKEPPKLNNFTAPSLRGNGLAMETRARSSFTAFTAPPAGGNGNGSGMHSQNVANVTAATLAGTEPAKEPPRKSRFASPTLLGIESQDEAPKPSRAAPSALRGTESQKEPPKVSSLASPPLRGTGAAVEAPRASSFTAATLRGIESAMELVSLQRHLLMKKRQLILGILLGILLSATVAFAAIKYKNYRTHAANTGPASTEQSLSKSDASGQAAGLEPQTTTPGSSVAGIRSGNAAAPGLVASKEVAKAYGQQPSPFDMGAPPILPKSSARNSIQPVRNTIQPQSARAHTPGKKQTPNQLWTAVHAGSSNAAVDLAELYIKGQGVARNCQQARVLLLMASEKRNTAAIKRLHDLDQNATACP